jgi:hypothetical protein
MKWYHSSFPNGSATPSLMRYFAFCYADCRHAKCHYAERRYVESCRGECLSELVKDSQQDSTKHPSLS